MRHFMRFTLVGMIIAGVAFAALAQDDDLAALLGDLVEDTEITEAPAEDDASAEEGVAEADALAEEAVAAADEVAEEPAAEASLDDLIADATADESVEEPAEEVVAEAEEPEVAEPEVSEEAVVAEDTPAEEPAEEAVAEADEPADDASLEDMLAGEVAEEPASEEEETPAEEVVAEAEDPEVVEPEVSEDAIAAEDSPAEEPAEDAIAEVEEPEVADEEIVEVEPPTEEPAEVEPAAEEAVAEVEPATEESVDADEAVAETDTPAPAEDALIAAVQPEEPIVTEADRIYSELAMLERIRQQGFDNHAMACLERARTLMTTPPPTGKAFEQYKEAIRMYNDAKSFFRERAGNRDLRLECDLGIREATYRQALALFKEKDYKKALELAQKVQKEGHEFGADLAAQINAEMNRPEEYIPEPILPPHAEDEYRKARLTRMERFERATVYFHLGNLDDARDQVELILREDPANASAISLKDRIEKRANMRADQLRNSMHDGMIKQVTAAWTPLGYLANESEELLTPQITKSNREEVDANKEARAAEQRIREKLDYIRLPEFSVRPPSTLSDVVELFSQMAKTFDKPELPPEERGVSFVLNVGQPTGAAPAEESEEDPFGDSSASSASGLPPIPSISLNYVTLREALDTVCEMTQSKYIIKKKLVMIVPESYVDGVLEERWYNVLPEFIEKMSQMSSDASASGDSGDGWGDAGGDVGGGGATDDWKKVFAQFGVNFEGKASIAYFSSIGKIRVVNTLENLSTFESVLDKLNVTPFQIEVEARFVEVSQSDLNSLGFEWRLNQDITGTIGSGIDWAKDTISNAAGAGLAGGVSTQGQGGAQYVFRNGAHGTGTDNIGMHAGTINNGMRFLGNGDAAANRINLAKSTIAPNDEFATFSAVFGKIDMTMILHMLAQRSDTDMLSAPKVLAKNGQEALFKVVQEWIYPTEFSVREIEVNNSGNGEDGAQVVLPFMVEPQSFEKRDVGIIMQVTPVISQEGQMIDLNIGQLEVVEWLEDFNYGMDYPVVLSSTDEDLLGNAKTNQEMTTIPVPMPQPKFHTRTISTVLSIYNGATVVMGGLITERREAFEDKTPILGDLPFIGFLFRSEGEYSEKRNLLIFLTARLVDPAGRPIRTATDGAMGATSGSTGAFSSTAEDAE